MGRGLLRDPGRIAHSYGCKIRAGYKWNAMKWHPQKNPGQKDEAEQRFRDVAEAFDVLIDPERRSRYDERGEAGLKYPIAGSTQPPYQYVGDPFVLFDKTKGDANPLALAKDSGLDSASPGLDTRPLEMPLELEVSCTLVELQDGTTRRVLVTRSRLGPGNAKYTESKPVTLPIKAGWVPGMRITFRGEGNHFDPEKQPGDLVMTLIEKQG